MAKNNPPGGGDGRDVVAQFRRFLPVLSHDVRSPMTAIKGAASLLSSGLIGPVDDRQRRFLEMCDRNSDLATLLIQDVVDLMKLSSEAIEVWPSQVNVVEEVHSCMDRSGAATALVTALDLPSSEVSLMADRSSVGRMLSALIRLPHGITEVTHARLSIAREDHGVRFSLVCGPIESTPEDMLAEVRRGQHQIEGRFIATGLEIHVIHAMTKRLDLEYLAQGGSGSDLCIDVVWPDPS